MARLEIEDASILFEIQAIVDGYGDLINEDFGLKILNYYKQAYYGAICKDYSEQDRKLAREIIHQQLEFLKNESFDSKRYKTKLINKLGFDTWLSWIFGKVVLLCDVKTTKIKSINRFVKEYFIDRRLKQIAEGFGTTVFSEKTSWEEDLFLRNKGII